MTAPRIALVHDWLNQMGGAENVLEELVDLFPDSPVYTSMYAPDRMPDFYGDWDIRTSFMQRLPGVTTRHQAYLPVYPVAFERMDLSGYDLVLSNKSGFCHGVTTSGVTTSGVTTEHDVHSALHVCYCLTPTRFLWLYDQYREREQIGSVVNAGLQPLLTRLRRWDYAAAQRVDHFIAISTTVQERIRSIYQRESVVIYPPVDTEYFTPSSEHPTNNYYLIVSRLIPYKRIDLAVDAFTELPGENLLIVGDGRDLAELSEKATENVTFLGRVSRERIRELLQGCKAFLFPGLEDFGIAPVEALSAGRPVLAFAGGGALDTVVPGVTGEFFQEQTPVSLRLAIEKFDPQQYDPAACRAQGERFSTVSFRDNLRDYLQQVMN